MTVFHKWTQMRCFVEGSDNVCTCIVGIRGTRGLCLGRRPCACRWWVQGRSQGTTLSTSDLHNGRTTHSYNMYCRIIKKISQKDLNRIRHSMHRCHSQSAQRIRPNHCLRRQWRHNPIQIHDVRIATQRTIRPAHVNGTELVLKSTDRWLNITYFRHVQRLNHGFLTAFTSKVIRWYCLSKIWRILSLRRLKN